MSEESESTAIWILCIAILVAATLYVFAVKGLLGVLWIAAVAVGYLALNGSERAELPKTTNR
jgi:hypothetical protein